MMSDKIIENNQVSIVGRSRVRRSHSAMKSLGKASIC